MILLGEHQSKIRQVIFDDKFVGELIGIFVHE
jgi:hypothetical protein